MFLSASDIHKISEFYSDKINWWETVATAVFSGGVAWFAAWLQIRYQRKNEEQKKEKDACIKRQIIEENALEARKIIIEDLKILDKYQSMIMRRPNGGLVHFTNAFANVLAGYSYHELFEIYKKVIDIHESGNLNGFMRWFAAVSSIKGIYDDLTKELSSFFDLQISILEDIESNQAETFFAIKEFQHFRKESGNEIFERFYLELEDLAGSFLRLIENPNESEFHIDEYSKFYRGVINVLNKKDYSSINVLGLRRTSLLGIKLLVHYQDEAGRFKQILKNRITILRHREQEMETFLRIFKRHAKS